MQFITKPICGNNILYIVFRRASSELGNGDCKRIYFETAWINYERQNPILAQKSWGD